MPAPRVLLGVTGGIAAYKACELLRRLTESGHSVRVLPTASALEFIGAATFEALSGQPVHTGVFADVPTGMPLAPWIEEMARLSVTSGCGGNNYCPNSPVTRGQMAVFMARTFHRPEAIRFLQQATWGPKDSEISSLLGVGYIPWLSTQFSLPPSPYPNLPLVPDNEPDACNVICSRDNCISSISRSAR